MNIRLRKALNCLCTGMSGLAVLVLALALVVVLGPILVRGATAVVFQGTVEWRRMQLHEDIFNRGDTEAVRADVEAANHARHEIYDALNDFRQGIDTADLKLRARRSYRQLRDQLRLSEKSGAISPEQADALAGRGQELRDALQSALETTDRQEAMRQLEMVLEAPDVAQFKDTAAQDFWRIARQYAQVVGKVDLSVREGYLEELKQVQLLLSRLLGPAPDQPVPTLVEQRYGATRWDKAKQLQHVLLWKEEWVSQGEAQVLIRRETRRAEQFAGTALEPIFGKIEHELDRMLLPQWTFYWQFFIDDSTSGHLFGGVGKEMLGTLLLTLLSMLLAFPVGVVTAAYLIECAGESLWVRAIRMCINTLAGVPSIVFGLFGLAFFMLWVQPRLGAGSTPSIFAGAATLAVLILPVIIRASEEAIRSVPGTYKEAALSLGAGGFHTFVTVTFPAALPGILTGVILSMSRAAGETAPLIITAAVASGPWADGLFQSSQVLSTSAYWYVVADKSAAEAPHNQYGMVAALVLLVLLLNLSAIILRWRVAGRLRGH